MIKPRILPANKNSGSFEQRQIQKGVLMHPSGLWPLGSIKTPLGWIKPIIPCDGVEKYVISKPYQNSRVVPRQNAVDKCFISCKYESKEQN